MVTSSEYTTAPRRLFAVEAAMPSLGAIIPVLRISDKHKAKQFYVGISGAL
jgi:hypothetical protein